MQICNIEYLSRGNCYVLLSKGQALSNLLVSGSISPGFSIAEVFTTFPHYAQERRGMAF